MKIQKTDQTKDHIPQTYTVVGKNSSRQNMKKNLIHKLPHYRLQTREWSQDTRTEDIFHLPELSRAQWPLASQSWWFLSTGPTCHVQSLLTPSNISALFIDLCQNPSGDQSFVLQL